MADTEVHVKKMIVPAELTKLLKEYPELRVDERKGKVCCCLTGHEMPLREDAVHSFVKGKKFLKAQAQREYDFKQHEPHLVPNTKKGLQHTLFCTLTLRCVTKRPVDVERHVSGKRYQRALQRWKRCQETGEKFKPRGGRHQSGKAMKRGEGSRPDYGGGKNFWQTDSTDDDGEEKEEEDDDLGDLYPSDDFASSDEDEDGSSDVENEVKMQAIANGNDDSSDSDSADAQNGTNAGPPHKALKRKKFQKPQAKKKRVR